MAVQGYVTLRSIINKILAKREEGGLHKYLKLKIFALDCVAELYADAAQEVKTVKIPMSALKTVELPIDCVGLVKVGAQIGDKVQVFLKDSQIALYFDENACGDEVVNASALSNNEQVSIPFYFANFINDFGEHKGGFYGYSNGAIDKGYIVNGKTIYFNSDVETTDVYIEYVSSGFNPSEETVVPAAFERAVEPYINWREDCYKKGPNSADADGWQRNYGKELTKGKARTMPLSVEDILHASRSGYNLSVKS
jgi:hypothetical protein